MDVKPCRSYRARAAGRAVVHMADGKSVLKIYFLDITGRDDPARYEWGAGTYAPAEFEADFRRTRTEGIGFVTVFPHISKLFRFAPSMETVLHVRAFQTRTLAPLDLAREEGAMEFACYAEAAIAADEYHAWAAAETVQEYLDFFSQFEGGPVVSHTKLAEHFV